MVIKRFGTITVVRGTSEGGLAQIDNGNLHPLII